MSTNTTPLEFEEECTFSDYLETRHFIHWHVPQETFTKSWATKNKNKAQGVRRGVPDHWVIIPTKGGWSVLVAIEMKRIKGGEVSDDQIEIIHALNKTENTLAVVCYGAEEAIKVVEAVEANNTSAIKDIIDYTNSLEIGKKTKKTVKKVKNECPF